ncbi:MAG: ABC transporter ATP-binding protein [Prevotella sp.]|nr:ABC transporter ATP-binding protein [Prevotella sp.]
METVVLQDLTIGYTSKGNEKVVAKGLNATLNGGELTCLLGRNGIGKSTLLRTLAAFQPPLRGSILLATSPLTALTDKELSRTIGLVLTERPDVQNMTVRFLVGMGRSPYTGFWGTLSATDEAIVDEAIRMVGIESLENRQVQTLSDGERQKVMIAKALAQQTPIIYLDEPTAFLDFPSKVEMMQLLRRLARDGQKTIFLSTHDVELSLQLADRIWLMEPDMLHVGIPHELADSGVLSKFIEQGGITFDTQSLTIRVQ